MIYKYFVLIVIAASFTGLAQNDTIRLNNGNILNGELKSLSRGVITLKTTYSDTDFRIEFHNVKGISIQRNSLVILTNGRRRFGTIRTDKGGVVFITSTEGIKEGFQLGEIVELNMVDDKFWHRFKGSIDLGFNLSKSNNLAQLTLGGNLKYVGELWLLNGSIDVLSSDQENSIKTKRTDANLKIYRIFPNKWFVLGEMSFLSNTEQALDGRISPSAGVGKFLVSTNKLFFGLGLGLTYNIENYVDASLDKISTEGFISTSFNMFDFEDFDLDSSLNFFPSLSEKGRLRIDFGVNLTYDLPWDFYIRLSYTQNFDNQPAIEGNSVDYVFTSGFGWKFD